jgi:hypothetical protein
VAGSAQQSTSAASSTINGDAAGNLAGSLDAMQPSVPDAPNAPSPSTPGSPSLPSLDKSLAAHADGGLTGSIKPVEPKPADGTQSQQFSSPVEASANANANANADASVSASGR